jgi:ribosomal protein S18 acetylase RimI-like enzyme
MSHSAITPGKLHENILPAYPGVYSLGMQNQALRFQVDDRGVTPEALAGLFQAAGLAHRGAQKIHRAYRNSDVVCFCFDAARLVATGRALTDGEYHATIYDVAVHPAYQRQGIGSRVMQELIERLPVWRVLLVAADEAQPFYTRLGFKPYADVLARLDPDVLRART